MNIRADRGFATAEFVVGVAVLILPMVILVALVPRWSEAQLAAKTAADAGAQAAVLMLASTDSHADARARGREAGGAVLATHGVAGVVDVVTTSQQVTVTVTVGLPAFPLLSRGEPRSSRATESQPDEVSGLTTTASAVRLVDPYRAPTVTP